MKKKNIESFLQDISDFDIAEKGKWSLEQHMTPPNFAADIMNIVLDNEDLPSQIFGDFGCGTGMLSSGLIYCGCENVVGFEIDEKYANLTLDTLNEKFEEPSFYDIINTDLIEWKYPHKSTYFDCVLMNPPFGTKNEGIDYKFLQKAVETCGGNIYSLHKSSTRNFLQKRTEEFGRKFEVLKSFKFPLPKRFNKYHKKEMGFAEVDLIVMQIVD